MKKNVVIGLCVTGILVSIVVLALVYLFALAPDEAVADRHAAGLGLAIPGDYMAATSPQQNQVIDGPVQVEVVLTNPDPDYRLNLAIYIPGVNGLSFTGGNGIPIAKILNTAHLSVPNLPPPAQGQEIVQGVVWNEEVAASDSLTLTLTYNLTAHLSPTIQLRAIAYDGLSGEPVDEAYLTFLTEPGSPLPAPTPRYSLTPVAIPDTPPGRVFSPTLAATMQSNSFESHNRAVQGLDNVDGADLIGLAEDVYPYDFRVLSLTQCLYLGVNMVNRAILEFDTGPVIDFAQATLRLRALPPNPGGHTISVHTGTWDWVFGQDTGEEGHTVNITNSAVWQQYDHAPLATFPVNGTSAVIQNIDLPRQAINPGGITRLLLISSDEADVPPTGSCFTGGPAGLGGAITLPELIIK